MVVTGYGAVPAHASLPLTFSHMAGLPRHTAPADVAIDGNGDVYVADGVVSSTTTDDRVVKYEADGTFLDVLAGPGTSTGLVVNPVSVAVAPSGDIYVLEDGNPASGTNEVSRYDSLGNYIDAWGGYGTGNGQFKTPVGIAIDSVGNVYTAENATGTTYDRIQKFTSDGTWVDAWPVSNPTGLAVDGGDVIWVSTTNTVYRFTTAGASAGSSWASSGATGIGADANGRIWVSSSSDLIRTYDASGTLLWTLGSGELTAPQGLDVTGGGQVYVADTGNGRVARFALPTAETSWASGGVNGVALDGSTVEAAGGDNLRTYTTSGTAGTSWASSGADDVTPDGSGNVWVSSNADSVVREYDATGSLLATIGSTELSSPEGVSFAGGKLFVADAGNDRIVRYATDGTLETSWAVTGVRDVAVSGSVVYATDGSTLRTYDTSGVAGTSWASGGATGVALDGSGNVWVSSSSGVVRAYTAAGAFQMAVGSGELTTPVGIALAGGKLYVADAGTNDIVRFSTAITYEMQWGEYPNPGVEDLPTGVAVDAAANVYVTNKTQDVIQKFDASGAFLLQWGGTGSTAGLLQNPAAIAVSPVSGDVYVADTSNQRIQRFSPTGTYLGQWGSFGTDIGQFDGPAGIAIDASGDVYVADSNNNRIQKFGAGGAFVTTWGSGPTSGDGEFKGPKGIAIDASGNVWVADPGNNRIQEFDASGVFLSKIAGTSTSSQDGKFSSPRDLDFDAEGTMWVADANNSRIQRLTTAGTYLSKLGSAGLDVAEFALPSGIAVDATGRVLVADTNNNRVQVFIDANGPDTFFDPGGPATISSDTTATFNFHANEPGSTFECRLDAGTYSSCTTGVLVPALAEGAHTYYVKATDTLSNVGNPATYDWTVDVTPPDAGIDSSPSSPTASTNANFTYQSTEANSTFTCALDAATPASCGSSFSQTVANGVHTFNVWATDEAGNQSTSPATYTWTVDTTPPVVQIDSGPSGYVRNTNASFTFDSPDTGASFECHLDGLAYASCTSPESYSSLSAGLHTFYVRGIDALGNISADKTRVWTIDLQDHKPDGWIGVSGKYVGNGVYNATATNQIKTLKTNAGKTVSFSVRVENDGSDTDSYTVDGGAGAKGYTVSYFVGVTDYTTKVTNGTYTFSLAPGSYKSITMKVKVGSAGKASWSSLVKVTSGHEPTKLDAVKGVVKRV